MSWVISHTISAVKSETPQLHIPINVTVPLKVLRIGAVTTVLICVCSGVALT